MKKLLLISLFILSSCIPRTTASKMQLISDTCQSYGFVKGTDEFGECMLREVKRYDRNAGFYP